MKKVLTNQIAIVTGVTRGIGKAITQALLDLDCQVYGIYKNSVKQAKELEKKYSRLTTIQADVSSHQDIKKVFNLISQKHQKIDILVNNVGIDISGKIETYKLEDWNKMIDTNLKSVFLFSKYSIPYLKKSGNGNIINISSRIGFPEFTEPEFVIYGMVKAGLTSFSVGLSKELIKDKIRVNVVIPTLTKTDLFDEVFTKDEEEMLQQKGKLGKPEEVADLVLKLLFDKSANSQILIDKRVNL